MPGDHTPRYVQLTNLVREAEPVIFHDSFPERFSSPLEPAAMRGVLEVLRDFLWDPEVVKYDSDVAAAGKEQQLSVHGNAWFGAGTYVLDIEQALRNLIDIVVSGGTPPTLVHNELRSGVTGFIENLLSSEAGKVKGVAAAAYAARSKLGARLWMELDRLMAKAQETSAALSEQKSINATTLAENSESELAKHYDKYSVDQAKSANRFRKWTIAIASLGGLVAAFLLLGPAIGLEALSIAQDDYVHLVQRIVVTVGIFGLAGYLARQAHQHRSLANWSGSLAVQLRTFEGFVAPVTSDDTQNEIRRVFAERAFGAHPAMKGEPDSGQSMTVIEKAMEIAGKTAGK